MYWNGQVSALSNDHKPFLPAEKERIEKAGGYVLFMDDIPNNARVNGALAVSRAFGDSMYKHSVLNPYERAVIAVPEINRFKLHLKKEENNDCFVVLGSDGVYDVMSNEQIATFVKEKLSEHMPLSDIAFALANNCLESEDNISVIIIRILA
jgi:serine/threonine protein phosphatase PrpC